MPIKIRKGKTDPLDLVRNRKGERFSMIDDPNHKKTDKEKKAKNKEKLERFLGKKD
jgi:hypothetical protein